MPWSVTIYSNVYATPPPGRPDESRTDREDHVCGSAPSASVAHKTGDTALTYTRVPTRTRRTQPEGKSRTDPPATEGHPQRDRDGVRLLHPRNSTHFLLEEILSRDGRWRDHGGGGLVSTGMSRCRRRPGLRGNVTSPRGHTPREVYLFLVQTYGPGADSGSEEIRKERSRPFTPTS